MKSKFQFQILSLNVRGLGEYRKNNKILNWISKHDGDNGVSFMQETHSCKDTMNEWTRRTRGHLIMSQGTSRSRGVAILIGNKLDYKIIEQIFDSNGRYIILLCEIGGRIFLFVNSYLPNYENQQLVVLKEIIEKIGSINIPVETYILWGGDFNFIFDTELEASGGNPDRKIKSIETMETIMSEYDLCDIWRIRNPSKKRFTWRGKAQGKSSSTQTLHRRLE